MNYAEKKQIRIERYKQLSLSAEEKSSALADRAREMQERIPFGQPILVGHHSEKRHRKHISNTQKTWEKAWEEQEKAEYYERRAEVAENSTVINSADDEAINKLIEKIKKLEKHQESMKLTNAYYRKHKTLVGCPEISEDAAKKADQEMASDLENRLKYNPCAKVQPFPAYMLSNNSATISSAKKRLEQLQQVKDKGTNEREEEGIKIVENAEAFRLQLIFDAKPEEKVRNILKAQGFRWSPSERAWQRHLNNGARYNAKRVIEEIKKLKEQA